MNIFYPASTYAFYPNLDNTKGVAISNSTPANPKYGTAKVEGFGVFKVKDADITSGYTAFYLNDGLENPIWGQNLGSDATPTFKPGTKLVVKNGTAFENSADVLPGLPDLPTAVEDIAADSKATGIYTIQGVKVNQANVPGIYIINGKKVVVK